MAESRSDLVETNVSRQEAVLDVLDLAQGKWQGALMMATIDEIEIAGTNRVVIKGVLTAVAIIPHGVQGQTAVAVGPHAEIVADNVTF